MKQATCAIRDALTLVMLSALLLILIAFPAQAQTETVLYDFTGTPDGANPTSRLTPDGAGNFYGTTFSGGLPCECGTVFELSPNGSGGWTETVLYSFTGGSDGEYPSYSPVIFDDAGNLYGTTTDGGTGCSASGHGCGVVFKLSPVGAGWEETVLYNFCSQPNCTDGEYPGGGLIMDSAGNLYGSVWEGVFELSPSGGGWTEQIIYTTTSVDPSAGFIMAASGNIFGVGCETTAGVTVFELSPNGAGGWNGTVIHKFPVVSDYWSLGGTPALDNAGNLYGTIDNLRHNSGYVYKLSPGKKGKWKEKILFGFSGRESDPAGHAGVVLDAAGNVYGASQYSVYELLAGNNYQEEILGSVRGGNDLILNGGELYGTSEGGGLGLGQNGYVFEITP
jgi:uncharacterized repeat protein (TIGR03803 family)